MLPIQSIVGIYKSKCGIRFDKDAAASLGLNEQTFNSYVKGRARMPDIAIAKIADGAQLDAMQVIAAMNLSYAKTTEEEKAFWKERYNTLMMYALRKIKIQGFALDPYEARHAGLFHVRQRPRHSKRWM